MLTLEQLNLSFNSESFLSFSALSSESLIFSKFFCCFPFQAFSSAFIASALLAALVLFDFLGLHLLGT